MDQQACHFSFFDLWRHTSQPTLCYFLLTSAFAVGLPEKALKEPLFRTTQNLFIFKTFYNINRYLVLWLMEPWGSVPHSQRLSNNSYPEPNLMKFLVLFIIQISRKKIEPEPGFEPQISRSLLPIELSKFPLQVEFKL